MAYSIDNTNGDFIISGFDKGIGDSPYSGITDLRNINITSVPSEADVNFATAKIYSGAVSGTITSVSGNVLTATFTGVLENRMAIYFTSLGSYSSLATKTPYWVGNLSGSTFKLYSDYNQANVVSVSGSGSAAFAAYQIGISPAYITGGGGPVTYFAQPINANASAYYTFLVDGTGLVWSDFYVTGTNSYWTYTGNAVTDGTGAGGVGGGGGFPDSGTLNGSGNGLVYWRVTNGALDGNGAPVAVDYVFVFRNSQIDFFVVSSYSGGPGSGVWTYGWNPATASINQAAPYLTSPKGFTGSHMALIHPNGVLYFCDTDNIGQIFQNVSQTLFVPTTSSTYSYNEPQLIPFGDRAQCLAPSDLNLLIGGSSNIVYTWDTFSPVVNNALILPEVFVKSMITVNTNTYIFIGNRGRIYITNGSQVQLWKKIPDHVSGTVEPYFQWGGTCYNKDQLFCSFLATQNSGTAITTMGGLWAIDTNTQAIRLANQLSYGTYAGYATAMIAQIYNPTVAVNGTGEALFIGWFDGTSNYGLDTTTSSLYTSGQAYVVSDMIPIGTAIQPTTPLQIEFKLSAPLVATEQVEIQVATNLVGSFTSVQVFPYVSGLTTLSGITTSMPVQEFQWILVKAILTAATSNPSFVRLTEMRIKGSTNPQTGYYGV
jgi:hypothetical protein